MEEGGKNSSGSSLASDLFGSKDSSSAPSSSSGIFGSIFAPPPKGLGSEHSTKTETKNNESRNPSISNKNPLQSEEGQSHAPPYYQEEQKVQPFHYSSSIYYGGQDVYSRPQDPQNPGLTTFSKDGGEDDAGSASRGNWWQGSLYY
ncbi:uncharacterized protein LOC127251060 [Andrographis paniculata]|uniref:uncharacterized protein LOC127251060 n=1 Tax=Andrographis paniculata TaxID=175694 RepID=UPI0021E855FB|nr:uncharacterized protein LOC127251060 [Andrographis paniculata]